MILPRQGEVAPKATEGEVSGPLDPTPLANLFAICSQRGMDRITAPAIASMILTAPAWARVGLTVRDERLRERAADCLAAVIVSQLEEEPEPNRDQLALPL